MSNVIPAVQTPTGASRWLAAFSRQAFVGMLLGLVIFYANNTLPLALVGLIIFGACSFFQTDKALWAILITVPLFLIPAEITLDRERSIYLPVHEAALLVAISVLMMRSVMEFAKSGLTYGWLLGKLAHWRKALYYAPSVLLLCAGILGVFWAVPEGQDAALRELRWLIIEPLLFAAALSVAFRRPGQQGIQNQSSTLNAFIISGVFVATIGLLQFIGIDLIWIFGTKQAATTSVIAEHGLWRVTSVYGNPNNLGLYVGRIWPIAVALLLAERQRGSTEAPLRKLRIAGLAIAALICLMGLVVSFSRGAFLGIGGALLVFVFPTISRRWDQRRIMRSVMLGALIMIIVGVAFTLRGGLASANPIMRLIFWHEALVLIQQHPLGIGLDQFFYYHNPVYGRSLLTPQEILAVDPRASHPHNLVLDIWLRTGPLGIVAFGWLIMRFFLQTRAVGQQPENSSIAWRNRGLQAAMIAALIHGLVDNFYFVPDLAFAFWLLIIMAETSYRHLLLQKTTNTPTPMTGE